MRPDQLIIPPEEFPILGLKVSQDRANGPYGWRRVFDPVTATGADFWWAVSGARGRPRERGYAGLDVCSPRTRQVAVLVLIFAQ